MIVIILGFSLGEADFVYTWGERMYERCAKELKTAKKEKTLRGVCDTLQSLVENFINFVAQKRGEWHNVAVTLELAPRLEEDYYKEMGIKGIDSSIRYALDNNIKDRAKLADHVDEWAQVWIRMATKLQDNKRGGNEEYLSKDELEARMKEYRKELFAEGEEL